MQPRKPAGTPAGGEFDRKSGSAPETSLGSSVDDSELYRHVIDRTEASSEKWGRRYCVDPGDVCDSVLSAVMIRQAAALDESGQNWLAESYLEHGTLGKYLDVAAMRAAWRLANKHTSQKIATARARLARVVASMNRSVSESEMAEIAADVATKVRNGHTLPDSWWVDDQYVSLDALIVPPAINDRTDDSDDLDDRKMKLISRLESNGITSKAEMWSAVAEAFDVPDASSGLLSEEYCTKVRKIMTGVGGVDEACRRWANEELTADEEFALFAPWGSDRAVPSTSFRHRFEPPSFDDQERIVEVLRSLGSERASRAWDSAVAGSMWVGKRSSRKQNEGSS